MTSTSTTRAARRRATEQKNVWYGTVLVVIAEAMLFFGLLYSFYYFRISGNQWPPQGVQLDLWVPSLSLAVLLLSGATMRWAAVAAKRDQQRMLRVALVATMLLGLLFIDGQVYEYLNLDLSLGTNVFASVFYMITGFHALHVVGGVLILLITVVYALAGQIKPQRRLIVRCAELYWQFVVVAWVVLFAALYIF
jgi:cytochrome c oxidase subunit III